MHVVGSHELAGVYADTCAANRAPTSMTVEATVRDPHTLNHVPPVIALADCCPSLRRHCATPAASTLGAGWCRWPSPSPSFPGHALPHPCGCAPTLAATTSGPGPSGGHGVWMWAQHGNHTRRVRRGKERLGQQRTEATAVVSLRCGLTCVRRCRGDAIGSCHAQAAGVWWTDVHHVPRRALMSARASR